MHNFKVEHITQKHNPSGLNGKRLKRVRKSKKKESNKLIFYHFHSSGDLPHLVKNLSAFSALAVSEDGEQNSKLCALD